MSNFSPDMLVRHHRQQAALAAHARGELFAPGERIVMLRSRLLASASKLR